MLNLKNLRFTLDSFVIAVVVLMVAFAGGMAVLWFVGDAPAVAKHLPTDIVGKVLYTVLGGLTFGWFGWRAKGLTGKDDGFWT